MLRPSYSELMDVLNTSNDIDSKVTSRYTIVIATAKRARQIIDGASTFASIDSDNAVLLAINEMSNGLITIKPVDDTVYYNESEYDEYDSEAFE